MDQRMSWSRIHRFACCCRSRATEERTFLSKLRWCTLATLGWCCTRRRIHHSSAHLCVIQPAECTRINEYCVFGRRLRDDRRTRRHIGLTAIRTKVAITVSPACLARSLALTSGARWCHVVGAAWRSTRSTVRRVAESIRLASIGGLVVVAVRESVEAWSRAHSSRAQRSDVVARACERAGATVVCHHTTPHSSIDCTTI